MVFLISPRFVNTHTQFHFETSDALTSCLSKSTGELPNCFLGFFFFFFLIRDNVNLLSESLEYLGA